jgi:hypothetical protein
MDDGRTGTGPDIMHVPVAVCSASVVTLRTARLASGERVGLAFTTQARLAGVCGPEQASILMHLGPLRAMLRPGGIAKVFIDPLGLKPAADAAPGRGAGLSSMSPYSARNIPAAT